MLLLGVVNIRVVFVRFPPFCRVAIGDVCVKVFVGIGYVLQFLYPLVVSAYRNLACSLAFRSREQWPIAALLHSHFNLVGISIIAFDYECHRSLLLCPTLGIYHLVGWHTK